MVAGAVGYQTLEEDTGHSAAVILPPSNDVNRQPLQQVTYTMDQAVDAIGFGWFQVSLSAMLGLFWLSESMELMLLSFLSPALLCDWHISGWKQAFVTTAVFMGMVVGQLFWGWFSDRYGRKTMLVVSASFLAYFGLLSAFSPTYIWLLILRGCVGFFMGAVTQAVTLYSEFLPKKHRGGCLILLDIFWALGAVLELILALFVMPTLGWRWLMFLSCLPVVLFAVLSPVIPESARYHAACGRPELARATIAQLAIKNGRPAPPGQLNVDDYEVQNRGRLTDLLSSRLWKTTLLLWTVWISITFCYYGIVLVSTELFKMPDDQLCTSLDARQEEQVCQASCTMLVTADYLDLLWTTLAEMPGILAAMLVIDKLGRKKTIACGLFIFTLSILTLLFCIQSRLVLTMALFVGRAMVSGVFQCIIVYTPEVYPTHLRATGMGASGCMARIGAMITPLVAQVLVHTSVQYTVMVYAAVAVLAAVATLLLPYETAGKAMQE